MTSFSGMINRFPAKWEMVPQNNHQECFMQLLMKYLKLSSLVFLCHGKFYTDIQSASELLTLYHWNYNVLKFYSLYLTSSPFSAPPLSPPPPPHIRCSTLFGWYSSKNNSFGVATSIYPCSFTLSANLLLLE